MNITHESEYYTNVRPNGALIYSINICKYFIPNIKTNRSWVTINTHQCVDNAIVFIHSNVDIDSKYGFLKDYKNLILVCSQKSTMYKVRKYGHAIYLPLSIDVEYTKKFNEHAKDKSVCYAGRKGKIYSDRLRKLPNVDFLENLSHESMLRKLSRYRNVYAVGITALEAKVLGCRILPYDDRYPDVSVWQVKDCREMIPILQEKLDKIDGKELEQNEM